MAKTVALRVISVAVSREDGLPDAGTGQVICKHVIDEPVNVFKDIPFIHPFLVIGRGGGDGKGIPLRPIPFRIDAVECKACDRIDIRPQCGFLPCGIDLARCDVLDVIRIGHRDIRRVLVGCAQMDGNRRWDERFTC